LLSRPQHDRVVLVNGQAIDRTLPDYRELDHLYKGATHEAATARAR
jgi:cytosine deaminase